MTITEFISTENINKENPFENCTPIKRIGLNEYIDIAEAAINIAFNTETGKYRPLFREMAVRVAIISRILDLEIDEDYDVDRLFEVVMTSGIYTRFFEEIALKIAPDMYSIEDGIHEYIDDKIEQLRIGGKNLDEKIIDTLINLLNNEAFQTIIEQITIDDTEKATETNE